MNWCWVTRQHHVPRGAIGSSSTLFLFFWLETKPPSSHSHHDPLPPSRVLPPSASQQLHLHKAMTSLAEVVSTEAAGEASMALHANHPPCRPPCT